MASTINNQFNTTFEDIIKIYSLLIMSCSQVRSSGAVCELHTEMNQPLRISEQYATIGDESKPWPYM